MTPTRTEKARQLEDLRARSDVIVRFLRATTRDVRAIPIFDMELEIIERGAREGNLRGLKLMHRDLVSDLKDRFEEDEAHRVAFEAIMSERFGSGAGTLPAVDWPAAAAILERGAIRDDDEYVLLRSIYDHHRPAGEMGGLDEDEVATLIGRWEAALDRDGGEP